MKIRAAIFAALLYALPTAAFAQCSGILQPGYFCGNPTAGNALAAGVAPTALFDRSFGSARGSMLYRGASNWTALVPGPLGYVLTSTGTAADPAYHSPPVWTPEDFTAKCDVVRVASSAVTISAGGTALTVVGANFATNVAGQVITIQGAGTAGAYHTTTIATRTGATTVTITAPAVTALAGVAKEVIYGSDSTVAFQSAATAMNAGTVQSFRHTAGCKYIVLPSPTNFQILMNLTAGARGVTYDGASAEIIVADPGRTLTTNFIKLTGTEDFSIKNFKGTAIQGYSGSGPGMNWFSATGAVNNLAFNVDLDGGDSGVDCVRGYQTGDTVFGTNVTVTGRIKNITYGVQNRTHVNGMFVNVDTENNLRSFIMYGTTGPTEFTLRSKNPKSNDLDIVAYGYNTDAAVGRTANIRGTYINVDGTTDYGNINLTHQQADPVVNDIATIIENVDITFYFNFPLAGANGTPITNESWAGHSGATSLGNVAHVERNIVFRGEFRGLALFAPMFKISIAANGWGALGDTHWIFEDITIPNASANPFTIGAWAKTTFRSVKATNLPKPVFEGSPSIWDHQWSDTKFADAGTNFGTLPLTSPFRVWNPLGAFDGIFLDSSARIDFGDGNQVGGTVYADSSKLYISANNARSIQFRTLSSFERWVIDTNGHFAPNFDNLFDIGGASLRPRVVYGATGQFNTVNLGASGTLGSAVFGNATSGTVTVRPVTGALGSAVMSLPAATDTFVGKATTDTLTNKTFDSAGTGNTLQISGVTVSRGQYPGINSNAAATAGNIGELVESSVAVGSAVSLTTGTAANITSISLLAGDWQLCGNVVTTMNGSTQPSAIIGSINTTSATHATPPNGGAYASLGSIGGVGQNYALPVGCRNQKFNSTTTVYLVMTLSFSVSTASGYGYIGATRIR